MFINPPSAYPSLWPTIQNKTKLKTQPLLNFALQLCLYLLAGHDCVILTEVPCFCNSRFVIALLSLLKDLSKNYTVFIHQSSTSLWGSFLLVLALHKIFLKCREYLHCSQPSDCHFIAVPFPTHKKYLVFQHLTNGTSAQERSSFTL